MSFSIRSFVIGVLLSLLLSLAGNVSAASPCSGKTQGSCTASDKCSWVKGYTTKKGVQVRGHCRAKGNKGGKKAEKMKAKAEKKAAKAEAKSAKKQAKADAKADKKARKAEAKSAKKQAKADAKRKKKAAKKDR